LLSADGQFMAVSIVNGPTRFAIGNTATAVSPAFNPAVVLVPSATQPGTGEFGGGRWDFATSTAVNMGVPGIIPYTPNAPGIGTSGIYGPSSSGGSTSNFVSTNFISPNGRFIGGLAYVSVFNAGSTAGTSITANSFYWRPVLWDAQGNSGAGALTVLPTPFRTSTNAGANTRRRTGNPYAASNDGLVVMGALEHNASTTVTADPDGGRLVVWRFDPLTSTWGMTYLPNGLTFTRAQLVDTPTLVGPSVRSTTVGSYKMNAAGTMIVGFASTDAITTTFGTSSTLDDVTTGGADILAKWTWNASTNSWDGPVQLASGITTPATWLPGSVTSCGVPARLSLSGVNEAGTIAVGSATYSTCGSFMAGGWIWTDPSIPTASGGTNGLIVDWYDYLVGRGVADVTTNYGPIGDNGDPTRGLPRLGYPSAISPDGSLIAGFQGGNQLIPGAPPWILRDAAISGCVSPQVVSQPSATVNFSRCSSLILSVSASGTLPITFQWFKNGQALVDGVTVDGSTVVGATDRLLRVNNPKPGDAGGYYCVLTGPCGSPVQTITSTVAVDPAAALANGSCATAQIVSEGTFNFASCGTFNTDPVSGPPLCTAAVVSGDAWYQYTPTFTGVARFDTCGSGMDTVVSVFDTCGGSELGCNDDYTIGASSGCSSSRSRADVNVTSGVPVLVRVTLKGTSVFSNTGQLRIAQAPARAAGDNCASPAIAQLGANAWDLTEATSSGEVVSCNNTNLVSRDVWYSFTQPVGGTLRAATCPGTTIDTVLSIHPQCNTSDIACSDNVAAGVCVAGTSTQSVIPAFPVAANTTYLIRVAGKTATTIGAGTLTLTFTPTPCTPSDVAGPNQAIGADGQLTADDIIVFLGWYFAGDIRADVAGPNQSTMPDAQFTADDIIVFLNRYFTGC
jgi:hypothetical protein